MKKIKKFSGRKRCKDGEVYTFKNGVAKVPGMWFRRKQIFISLSEFKKLNN